jgi:type III secretory pathway component EscV
MDNTVIQLIRIKVELPLNLTSALKDPGVVMEMWPFGAGTELDSVLAELGIPGKTVVHAGESNLVIKPRVLINGLVQEYSLELVKAVAEYFSPQLPAANIDQSWANTIADHLGKHELRQFLTALVVEIVKQRPERLLTAEQAAAYLHSASQLLSEAKPNELPVERVQNILGNILSLRISIANAHLIVDQIARGLKQKKSDAEITESLIPRLAPDHIEMAMPAEYLKQLFGVTLKGKKSTSIYKIENKDIQSAFQAMTDHLFRDLGLRVPDLVLAPVEDLKPTAFSFKINHVRGCRRLGPESAKPAPASTNVQGEEKGDTENANNKNTETIQNTDMAAVRFVIEALLRDLVRNAACLLHSDIVEYEFATLHRTYPEFVMTVLEDVPLPRMTRTLRELLRERVGIRNLRLIGERILTCDYVVTDPSKYIVFDDRLAFHAPPQEGWRDDGHSLAQRVRSGMKRYLSHRYTRGQSALYVYLLAPEIEKRLLNHLSPSKDPEKSKRLSNEEMETIREAIRAGVDSPPEVAGAPVIVTSPEIRYFLRRLIEFEYPSLAVLSWDELSPELNIQQLSRITFQ